ncbi:MAG: hypothetical protein ACK5Q6_09500 [Cyanobacteriota bacterium]|jgi:hypothetical protein
MTWTPYLLDNIAQKIVLDAIERDVKHKTKSLVQAHRLRSACAYGLERFWGEQIRLLNEKNDNDKAKGQFTKDVWRALALIMKSAGVVLPDEDIVPPPKKNDLKEKTPYSEQVRAACNKIRNLDKRDAQASLAVLASLCEAIVWWKQRLSKEDDQNV